MPRYEYRNVKPTPEAEKRYLAWIERLDREFVKSCRNCIWASPME
jgi:hypothetical protein